MSYRPCMTTRTTVVEQGDLEAFYIHLNPPYSYFEIYTPRLCIFVNIFILRCW